MFQEEATSFLNKQRTKLVTKQATALSLIQKVRQKQTPKSKIKLAAALSSATIQSNKFKFAQQEILKEATVLTNALSTTQANLLSTKLVSQQALIGKKVTKGRLKARPKPFIPKIIVLPKGVKSTKLVKAIQKVGIKGMDVLVGQKLGKQKIIGKNLPPFKALKKGLKFVDSNIEASFRLKPSKKKARGEDILAFNVGRKFRPSKKNVLFLVEKRKFRLDHPREVKQLNLFKGKIPSGFFPKVKKKRKKKS